MPVLPQIILQTPLNTQSLRDIKPPLDIPQNLLPYILLSGLILAVIAGIVWLYIRKRHQTLPPPLVEEVNTQPAHEIALEQLKMLETASYDMETYHTRISFVIREYIAARYQIPALELTTTRLLQQMTREKIDDLYVERIQQFLTNCDWVKFTKYQPERSEADARMVDARWFVEKTKTPIP
jgi:hypothetical protein